MRRKVGCEEVMRRVMRKKRKRKVTIKKGYMNFREIEGLSSTERFELKKLHLQIQKRKRSNRKRKDKIWDKR